MFVGFICNGYCRRVVETSKLNWFLVLVSVFDDILSNLFCQSLSHTYVIL